MTCTFDGITIECTISKSHGCTFLPGQKTVNFYLESTRLRH